MPKQQYVLREYTNGGQEIICTSGFYRKITYNTGDIVWMKMDKVIAIKPHDYNGRVLKYTDDILYRIDALSLPKLTPQAEAHLYKQWVTKSLEKDAHFFDAKLLSIFKRMQVPITEITKDIVLRFHNILPNKEKRAS